MYVSFTLAAPPSHELQALVPCVSSSMRVELCVFISKSRKWTFFLNNAPQSNGMCFPNLWSTDHVLAFEGRFLCWVDYFSGVMLFDFSGTRSPVLHFVLFPGGIEYPAEARAAAATAPKNHHLDFEHDMLVVTPGSSGSRIV
nr:uncharacterized protein LOC123493470 [Aegilops tauschii subsp. strangulata]